MDSSRPPFAPPIPVAAPAPDRSEEILALIRDTFVDKGFDGASMQNLARAAGMSVGNFYRYFPSKAAIVEAMVNRDLAEIERKFSEIHTADDLLATMRMKIAGEICATRRDKSELWAEINAAAHRKVDIAAICARMEDMITDNMLMVFTRVSGLTPEACKQRFSAHARFVVLMIKAASTRSAIIPDPDVNALILQSLNRILDEVAHARRDPDPA